MAAPTVGDTLPEIELEDLDGAPVPPERWRGRPLLLVFLRHPG